MKLKGRVWKYGADIDTDKIIPARYLNTSDPAELAKHCMEDEDPSFASKVQPGDMILADKNFGCGSSREHAPIAIKAAGVACVIAKSFARIFYRNSFNMGLTILESDEVYGATDDGDVLEIDVSTGSIVNLTKGKSFTARPVPPFMQELIKAGGLMESIRKRGFV
ncbi:MAG: 3-isopropylmalate dehydratase small subunit [Deltaproteobacteria bacterium]|nr:3-isopropylmalate dehydratase small subunit [Deltaproteobacteria bacterium]MBZ0218987.1 3-isopropylmalate dehydratase small subunit [Deltaproteobacteria bacterium]